MQWLSQNNTWELNGHGQNINDIIYLYFEKLDLANLTSQKFKNRDSQWKHVFWLGIVDGWVSLTGTNSGKPRQTSEDSSGWTVVQHAVQDAPGHLMSDNPVNQNEQKTPENIRITCETAQLRQLFSKLPCWKFAEWNIAQAASTKTVWKTNKNMANSGKSWQIPCHCRWNSWG